ncbi:hypothetical protein KAT24_01465 [Candidatus Pacearchaeota archaeon]|nr:hypothetical protein [Candidatus Pacearchaeota archaeon]
MKERGNVLRILEETKKALRNNDAVKLKEMSNRTIHTASIDQDLNSVAVAVIVYSLSKIIEREDYKKYPGWSEFHKLIVDSIDKAIAAVSKGDDKELREQFGLIRKAIGKLSGKLKIYIQDVFRRASINKASRIYEHGISMERTASLLGITMFELSEYAGKTGISDVPLGKTLGVKKRIKLAMEIFE